MILPPGAPTAPDAAARYAARAGAPGAPTRSAEVELAGVRLVTLAGRPADDECGGAVELGRWRSRLDGAEASLLRLDFTGGLAALVALEVELPCLRSPPTGADLLRLALTRAQAHDLLARAARADAGSAATQGGPAPPAAREGAARALHEAERDAALDRAAAWGVGLAPPGDQSSAVAAGLTRARERADTRLPAVVVLVGPDASPARVDGRPVGAGPLELPPGDHLVQLGLGEVVAAALVHLDPGERLVAWAERGAEPWDDARLLAAWADLGRRDDPRRDALLAGVAAATRGEAWFLGARVGDGVWSAADGTLVPWWPDGGAPSAPAAGEPSLARRPARASPDPGRDGVLVGVGAVGAYSGVRGGPLDGLGGLGTGPSLFLVVPVGRVGLTVAAALPGVPSRIPVDQGGGLLFRATLPVRAGFRWVVPVGGARLQLGPEAGVHLFGPYDGAWRLSPVGGGAVEVVPGRGPVAWFLRGAGAAGWTRASEDGGAYGMVGLEAGLGWRR